ncbi:MAG TPA: NAD(P)H-hydrate dehydratase [Membranihabitans sp.]|nr:NAD(P)H-hydrate dehydratase [Membranihabitans sp.]
MKILNQEQMRWVDQQTMIDQRIPATELMDRAVHELYNCIHHFSWFDPLSPVYVFAGSGNNGGDGIGLARLLGDEGVEVHVYICDYGSPTGENQYMRDHLPKRKYLTQQSIESEKDLPVFESGGIIIDALFGSGINRPVEGLWQKVVEHINNDLECRVISIDIPSGLHPDQIKEDWPMVRADVTLTIGQPKYTFFFPELEEVVGKWQIVDIQHSETALEQCDSSSHYIDESYIKDHIHLHRHKFSHKGTFGHALLINGSYGKMGAAVLAARSCLRSGVGLLTCHVPRIGYSIMQISVPESMVSVDQHEFYFHTKIDVSPYDAIGIGSGIDNRNGVCDALLHVIENTTCPLILDADALNILAQHTDWLSKLPDHSVLTPHPGEFRRLFGSWETDTEKLDRQIELSRKYKIIIVLKGAHTSISFPDGMIFFNSTGNPGMATAGSGDTLTGILTSLYAQGLGSRNAAILGVYIHGLAGDLAIRDRSVVSLVSSDITDQLGKAFYQVFGA